MLLFCGKCGAEIPEGNKYCEKCGATIDLYIENGTKEKYSDSKQKTHIVNVIKKKINLKKPKKIHVILLCIALVFAMILILFYTASTKYQSACQLIDKNPKTNDNRIQAINLLEEIPYYKDSNELLKKCKYDLALTYETSDKYEDAIKLFKQISSYQDSSSQINECLYQQAVDYLNEGKLDECNLILSKISGYKDSQKMLNDIPLLKPYQGTWYDEDGNDYMLIGCTFKFTSFQVEDNVLVENDGLRGDLSSTLKIVNNNLVESFGSCSFVYTREKPQNTNLINIFAEKEPAIGMTAEEVNNSTWGKPNSVNKTTTAYGVSEQWCYSGDKYIYLEDGIVTAIQN